MAKTYASTYLYSKYNEYEQKTIDFILKADRIDQNSSEFEDIIYEVRRRQISPAIVKVLKSPNVVLMTRVGKPLSKAFKVFCAKDIKSDKQLKVFIDVSGVIRMDPKSGKYVCDRNSIDVFTSYLVSAMITYIYYAPNGTQRIIGNSKVRNVGAKAFADLFSYIVDYLCKISTIGAKPKCSYMAAMYYQVNILGSDPNSESVKGVARKVAGISDREAEIIMIKMKPECFTNIKFFVESVADVLHLNKMTLETVVEKWMYVYGTGTVFALELFPAFSSMLTDAYVGAYVNNQKTIEKVAGPSMIEFTKTMLEIGVGSV